MLGSILSDHSLDFSTAVDKRIGVCQIKKGKERAFPRCFEARTLTETDLAAFPLAGASAFRQAAASGGILDSGVLALFEQSEWKPPSSFQN